MIKIRIFSLIFVPLALFFIWQQTRLEHQGPILTLRGNTMGTTYTVKVHGTQGLSSSILQDKITARLKNISRIMSTWDQTSEISRFNQSPAHKKIPLSPELYLVVKTALDLSRASEGAFDPTVGPLVDALGFGPSKKRKLPNKKALQTTADKVGYKFLVLKRQSLEKTKPGVELDLSAIAKGYGVDQVALLLEAEGAKNYLVEIGGETRVLGKNLKGNPWAIGIETPTERAKTESPKTGPNQTHTEAIVGLSKGALATSGRYRRFISTNDVNKKEGKKTRHHIIDPRTGRSSPLSTLAVTVFAPTCMIADALATTLMVLGPEKGLIWLKKNTENYPQTEARFISPGPKKTFITHQTPGFKNLLL